MKQWLEVYDGFDVRLKIRNQHHNSRSGEEAEVLQHQVPQRWLVFSRFDRPQFGQQIDQGDVEKSSSGQRENPQASFVVALAENHADYHSDEGDNRGDHIVKDGHFDAHSGPE